MSPSNRRLKTIALATILSICVIFYITRGASQTHNSQFYTRTVQAIRDKQTTKSQEEVIAEERHRLERVDRIEKEHNAALSAAAAPPKETNPIDYANGSGQQNPIIPNGDYGVKKVENAKEGERSVAGRKYMKDGKVVTYKPLDGDEVEDGVAKVGNVEPLSSHEAVAQSQYDKQVEAALNDILRKGPIIIFSKSYCPHSKQAKHILLDLYSIVPPPYVVELDQHELGSGLQAALNRLTGRHTVPNVMINGKSIGGGDEMQELHNENKVISTIMDMVGKRMTKVEKKDDTRLGLKFKA